MSATDKQKTIGRIRADLLSTLALLSGCCSLAYEVLYVRALTAVLGDMFYVHAALLSTFLVGIGLGSKLAHRVLRWLWAFETLTGLWALGLPIILKWVSEQSFLSLVTSSPAFTILATIGFISLPSLLIGFSIPLFSAYIKALQGERLAFQGIYKVYNLGAFLSILGVELVLIRYFGIRLSLATVGIINVFNGAILLAMRAAPAHKPTEKPRRFEGRIIFALAIASLGSAVFQMFFFKLSYLLFYPHRENFAIGLSVTMFGIFLGAWAASKVRISFETFLVLTAGSIALIYVNYLPILRFYEATINLVKGSESLILIQKFFFGCLFALAPMTFLGALIPALMRTEKEVAGESGQLLWVSSLANAVGYLVYVVIGHPLLSSGTLLGLIAGTMLLASLLSSGLRWSKIQWALAGCSVVLVIFLISGWNDRNFYLAHWASQLRNEDDVKLFRSGAESATLVHTDRIFFRSRVGIAEQIRISHEEKNVWQDIWISYNGHPSISIQHNGVVNFAEIAVGVIPAFSAPRLERALVIGLGTGITAGATCRIFKATDVVEINKAFCEMMPYLKYANFDIEHNPSAILHISDGRAFLVGKDGTYDAIISTVSAPTYFSASKIYTLNFYKRVRESLKPDGVFCTWISVADMSRDGMMTILSALRHNFLYCELRLLRGQYYVLTSSNQPIRPKRQFSELPPDRHHLSRQLQQGLYGIDLDEFFTDTVLSENIFDHFTPEVPHENTDDHPVLEFMAARSEDLGKSGADPFSENPPLLNINPLRGPDVKEAARFARKAAIFWRHRSRFFEMYFQPILLQEPNSAYEFFLLAADYKAYEEKFDEAANLLNTALNIRPDSAQAYNNLGNVLAKQGKLDEAISHFRRALQIQPDFAEAHNNLGNALAAQGKAGEAISHFRQATQIRPNFIQAYINLGNSLASEGKFDEASRALQEALTYNKQSGSNSDIADIHLNLAMILKKSNETQQANEELANAIKGYRQVIADDPQSAQLNACLADALAQSGNLSEATAYFRKAVELNPTILDNQFKLTEALKSQGQVDEAVKASEKAILLFSKLERKDAVAKLQQQFDSLKYKKSK